MYKNIKKIYKLIDTDKNKIILLVFLFLFLSMFDLMGISIIAPYINLIINSETESLKPLASLLMFIGLDFDFKQMIIAIGLTLSLIFLFKTIASIFVNRMIIKFGYSQRKRLTNIMMQNYYNMHYLDFIKRNSADYIKTVDSFTSIYAAVLNNLLKLISDLIVALVIITFLIFYNPLAVLTMAFVILILAIVYERYFRSLLKSYGIQSVETSILALKSIKHAIEGFKENKILGTFKFFHKKVMFETSKHLDILLNQQTIAISPRYIFEFLIIVFCTSFVSLLLISNSPVDVIASLGVFAFASLRLMPISSSLLVAFQNFSFQQETIDRLYNDYFNINSEIAKTDKKRILKFTSFEMSNIYFSYDKNYNKNIINNISIKFNKGEQIGIIGESGSGKTTLMDLILGLIKPTSGTIIINNLDINKVLFEWQNQIAYISQNSFIIDDTIEQNIALGFKSEDINLKEINDAINRSNLSNLVDDLPNGINELVGEKGSRISGGQIQRISIARALYHKREIILFDESTSSLDTGTEEKIINELKNLKGKKTLVLIAHKLSSLRFCDRIYTVKDGMIDSISNYKELKMQNKLNMKE